MSASIKHGWANLSSEQRDTLLNLYNTGAMSNYELAKLVANQYGVKIKPETLARRLREWRAMKSSIEQGSPGIKISGNKNSIELSSTSERIRTLDELLEASNIDLNVWEVSHYIVNTYESFRKKIDKSLTFDKGVVDGHVSDSGDVTIVPLYQVKAWLVRKEPIKIYPVVEPISFKEITFPSSPKRASKTLKTAVILPDPQFGFRKDDMLTAALSPMHDRKALDVALQITQKVEADDIIWLGDFLDLADWNDKYLREIELLNLTQQALIEGGWWLAQFRMAAPNAKGIIFEGNHEKRMVNSILRNLPAAYKIKPITFGNTKIKVELDHEPALSIPNLLSLDALDYEFIDDYPNNTYWLNNALRIEHGSVARTGATDTSKAILKNITESVIYGHIHRIELATKTIYTRDKIHTVTAFSPGCLCRIDGMVPGVKKQQQWQQGMAVVKYDLNGELFSISPVFINDGVASYDGVIYKGRDRRKDISENTALEV